MAQIAPPPASQGPIKLGFLPMDEIHEEFDTLVARTLTCADTELPEQLELLLQHLRSHFNTEDQWMQLTNFPARECHINEHAAVLRSAEQVQPLVVAGNIEIGRTFATELDKWFRTHADYLDSALAVWMCKRRLGGAPVVLHRKAAAS